MRLICPNCGAQYEVESRVIPEGGRDVQCSSCGHTWFQRDEGSAAPPVPPQAVPADAPPRAPAQPRRADATAMSILREEAARERAARAAARGTLEEQPDLGLSEAPHRGDPGIADRPEPPPARPAIRGAAAELPRSDEERAVRPAPRRSLLPDIEEINSTLGPAEAVPRPEAATGRADREERRRGSRLGFGVVVAIFAAAALLYVQGEELAAALPALEGPLLAYVEAVNGARLWLDGLLRRAVGAGAA